MSVAAPHFLLFSEARRAARAGRTGCGWRFVLEAVDGENKVEAADEEPGVSGDRLDLLAVVRGLEALDQPSRVTLVTSSRYVSEGIRSGLAEWRESDWQWEHFGQMTPIKNQDLWLRVDRALRIHQVECRRWRFDPAHGQRSVWNQASDLDHSAPRGSLSIESEPLAAVGRTEDSSQTRPEMPTGPRSEPCERSLPAPYFRSAALQREQAADDRRGLLARCAASAKDWWRVLCGALPKEIEAGRPAAEDPPQRSGQKKAAELVG